jgi:hypothetical protein
VSSLLSYCNTFPRDCVTSCPPPPCMSDLTSFFVSFYLSSSVHFMSIHRISCPSMSLSVRSIPGLNSCPLNSFPVHQYQYQDQLQPLEHTSCPSGSVPVHPSHILSIKNITSCTPGSIVVNLTHFLSVIFTSGPPSSHFRRRALG